MIWRLALTAVLVSGSCLTFAHASLAQSFTCPYGTDPVCLDYGDSICGTQGMCVDQNAACFDSYECDYNGFACKSDVNACVTDYEDLLREHNSLVSDYNALLKDARDLEEGFQDLEACVLYAATLDQAKLCN